MFHYAIILHIRHLAKLIGQDTHDVQAGLETSLISQFARNLFGFNLIEYEYAKY